MSDSNGAAQDDGARVNGLMATLGKRTQERDDALRRIAELEAAAGQGQQGNGQAQDPGSGNSHQGPEGNPGDMFELDESGRLVPFEAPTPGVHNGRRDDYGTPRDDGSASFAMNALADTLHVTDSEEWQ